MRQSQFCLLQNKPLLQSVTTNRVLESVNGGMIRVTSDMYASGTDGHEDPFSNGGRVTTDKLGGDRYNKSSDEGVGPSALSRKSVILASLLKFRPGVDRDLSEHTFHR